MFSLKPCDELVFGTPTTSQGHQSETNLISFSAATGNDEPPTENLRSRRQRKSRNECNIRRVVMHRDYERKRRQEMSNLFVSLGSLLPLDPNKGRISVCNQMEEAANYIKQMHNKIQQLQSRREELMKKFDKSSCWGRSNAETSDDCSNCVAIHQSILKNRLEILIPTKTSDDDLELSRVLAELVEREMDIVSCLSTRTNAGFLHKIEIEAKDITNHDVSVLHDRLADAIK